MSVYEEQSPNPVYIKRVPSNQFVSTIVSSDVSGIASGTAINVGELKNITAYVQRRVSTNAVELEVSPDGTNWWQWKNYATGALADEYVSQEVFVSGGAINYVRGVHNVSGTATSGVVVTLNALTK